MSVLLQNLLISHVILGLLGIVAFYIVWMGLLKRELSLRFLQLSSLGGLLLFIFSWFTGGYYYVVYYGKAVKPIIKASQYPWAHSIVMEAKEHIFLFLPFLAAIIFLTFWFFGERLETNQGVRRSLIFVTGLTVALGIIITLAGVIISGAVR